MSKTTLVIVIALLGCGSSSKKHEEADPTPALTPDASAPSCSLEPLNDCEVCRVESCCAELEACADGTSCDDCFKDDSSCSDGDRAALLDLASCLAGCASVCIDCSDGLLSIPREWACDGEEDCQDGSDEQGC